MPTAAAEVTLFLSSFAPLFVVFGLLHSLGRGWPTIICYAVAALSAGALIFAMRIWRQLATTRVEVARARHRDTDAIAYVATYIVPFAALGTESWESRAALLLFMALVGVLYIRAHLFYVNPLLSAVGFHLFEIETASGRVMLVLSRRKYMRVDGTVDVRTLSDYIFLEANAADSSPARRPG